MKKITARLISLFFVFAVLIGASVSVSAVAPPPTVSAESAVLAEGESGKLIWSVNADKRLPMASTTKIMTALVAIETTDRLDREVVISPDACGIEGSSVYLKAGERLTLEQLLYALLLESANDCACAIAIDVAGSVDGFTELMNATAERLGMTGSHFTNPHGLDDPEHYTTAADMARLTVYALKNAELLRIVSTRKTEIPLNGDEGTRLLINHNKLLKYYDGAIGVKTGFTKRSGRCLVSAAERDGVRMIAVTLNAPDDWSDHAKMLDHGFALYHRRVLAEVGAISYDMPVTGGDSGTVRLTNRNGAELTLPIDSPEVRCVIDAPRFVYASVSEGCVLGHARFYLGDTEIRSLPLYAESSIAAIEKPSLWHRIKELYK